MSKHGTHKRAIKYFIRSGAAAAAGIAILTVFALVFGKARSDANRVYHGALVGQYENAGADDNATSARAGTSGWTSAGCVGELDTFATAVAGAARSSPSDRLYATRTGFVDKLAWISSNALSAEWFVERLGQVPALPKRLGSQTMQLVIGRNQIPHTPYTAALEADGSLTMESNRRTFTAPEGWRPHEPLPAPPSVCGRGFAPLWLDGADRRGLAVATGVQVPRTVSAARARRRASARSNAASHRPRAHRDVRRKTQNR